MIRLYPNEEILAQPRGEESPDAPIDPRQAMDRLAEAVARLFGLKRGFCAASGRAALAAILSGLNLQPGARVVLSAYNFYGLAEVIERLGLAPVYVDPDPVAARLDPVRTVTGEADAAVILVTHLFGVVNDAARIRELAGDRAILVEDCCHILPSAGNGGAKVGTSGRAAFISFDRLKLLNAISGGMALTGDDQLAAALAGNRQPSLRDSRSMIADRLLYEIERLVRRPELYAIAGRLLANQRLMDRVRRQFRRARRDRQALQAGLHPLLGDLGLRQLAVLAERQRQRQALIAFYLERLTAKAVDEPGRAYARALGDAFAGTAYGLIVTVDRPAEFQRRARQWGFEVLIGDRVASFLPPGSGDDFPRARHLAAHAVKLPVLIDADPRRLADFVERSTDLAAARLAPME
ncbi:MAG: DegT/DnrJ/EryC1/StrS aminotransferase family protein [Myxococcales bacterium]|nr:DegT/DnrJ/EryC1/StrS aminotransferase family protein [Myxococcales bacterium]